MKYVIFAFVILVFLFFRYRQGEKTRRETRLKRLKEQWGQVPDREYADGDMKRISRYYQKCREEASDLTGAFLDDITWNDLGMDDIFMLLNHTQSSVGEEALYRMLRTPVCDEALLQERSRLAEPFCREGQLRLELEEQLSGIGKNGRMALCDYIFNLSAQPCRSNVIHYLGIAVLTGSVCGTVLVPRVGIFALVAAVAFQMITYYREKAQVESCFSCVATVVRLAVYGQKICEIRTEGSPADTAVSAEADGMTEIRSCQAKLRECVQQLEPIRRRAGLISTGTVMGGSPLDLAADYVKMLLHVDLIAYNRILRLTKDCEAAIWDTVKILGQLECALAVASFREFLGVWCKPRFAADGKGAADRKLFLHGEALYHPLVDRAVPNTVYADRCQLITGSNASGKSTFLKTAAVNAILAQTIYTVAGTAYEAPFYQIYSSMALRDDLAAGESYYMAEIRSLKRILDRGHDSLPVLCFVDEVLRGTNTVERIAASAQVLKSMAGMNILCFAATHDGELTYLLEPWYDNSHFEEEVSGGDVIFSYRLYPGRAVGRNALKLLSLIGYDEEVLKEAQNMAERFDRTGIWSMEDES